MASVAKTLYDNPRSKPADGPRQFPREPRNYVEGRDPKIDHEDKMDPQQDKEGVKDFEALYKQLRGLKEKVDEGNLLRLKDKKGNEFFFQRDENYPHGFSIWVPPLDEPTS